jgi:energy-coupling factor transport system permease protein
MLRGFEFRRGTTVFHKMDPRAKLVYIVLFAALSVVFVNLFVLIVIFLSTVPIVLISRIKGKWSQSIWGSKFFIFMIFIFNFIIFVFSPKLNLISALLSATSMSIRFLALISVFSVFFLTTSPEDLTQSMVQLKVPYDYALTFNMAMRFVPTLSRETQIIMDAQKSRGLEMEKGNLIQRIRNYIPVLIPLIISSFRRAELVADAMESRAFGASKKRVSMYVLTLSRIDVAFIIISVLGFIGVLSLRLFLGIA